ncbi:MAG: hypothetical protein ACE5LU_01330 [Anaerolineae bacterium]
MEHMRRYLVVPILALVLLTSACSTQRGGGQVPESTLGIVETAANFIPEVHLPPLELSYDQDGVPRIYGIKTTDIQRFTGISLRFLELDKPFIDWFTRSNLQHIEIEHTKDGLFLYANGELLPSVGWDSDSLASAVELADMLNVQYTSMMTRLVPVLQRLGLHITLRFPVAPGNAPIALSQPGAQPSLNAEVEQPSAVVHLAVEYREDGLPSVLGLTSQDIAALTQTNLWFVELSDDQIAQLKHGNLQNLEIEARADGLRMFVNGKELPRLVYSPEQLDALVSLYAQLFPGYQPSPDFLRETITMIQQADVDLMVQFPLAAEAERIPLHDGQIIGN